METSWGGSLKNKGASRDAGDMSNISLASRVPG